MSKDYSVVTKFEKMHLVMGLIMFVVIAVPLMILLDSPYRSGEELATLVQGNFFHPIKLYITLGLCIAFLGLFGQFAGPFDLYYRSETSERYVNWKLITLSYVVIFCIGLGIYYYGGFFLRRELLGQEISVYYFFSDFFFPSESLFENLVEGLLSFAVGVMVITKAWEELKYRDCYLEIDDNFIAWELPEAHLTSTITSTPSANIAKSNIEKISIIRNEKNIFQRFSITTTSKKTFTPTLEIIDTFGAQIQETLVAKYSALCTEGSTESTAEDKTER